jgi:hypothetical protein
VLQYGATFPGEDRSGLSYIVIAAPLATGWRRTINAVQIIQVTY